MKLRKKKRGKKGKLSISLLLLLFFIYVFESLSEKLLKSLQKRQQRLSFKFYIFRSTKRAAKLSHDIIMFLSTPHSDIYDDDEKLHKNSLVPFIKHN
jgi:hypothetical protein